MRNSEYIDEDGNSVCLCFKCMAKLPLSDHLTYVSRTSEECERCESLYSVGIPEGVYSGKDNQQ